MEDDQRTFQAVSIDMASTETGAERFVRDNLFMPPPISNWRCNLTALSRRYNLYFVASRSGIAVYQPDFPFQKLKRTPKLYIVPTLADPGARGYIDERHPHAINHLIVGDLGTEEILLAATDSGNVTAYHTRSIEDAIKRDPYKFSSEARSDHVGLRAFFSQWVKESAWGLAIHREARMIAVSANTPRHTLLADFSQATAEITVFAFALTEQGADESDDENIIDVEAGLTDGEWSEWRVSEGSSDSPPRDRNHKIILCGLGGHIYNVPSISFVNTTSDAEGAWLLSTDISGCVKVWQIWRRSCRTSWQLPEGSDFNPRTDQVVHDESGWMVAALDPSSFREACTMQQFCGHHTVRKYLDSPGESYDLSDIVRATIPDRSERHPLMAPSDDEEDPADDDELADHLSDEEQTDADASAHHDGSGSTVSSQPAATLASSAILLPRSQDLDVTADGAADDMQRDIEELLLDHYISELEDSDNDFDGDSRTGDAPDEGTSDDHSSASSGSVASRTSFSNVSQRSSVGVGLEPMSLASPNASNRPSPVDSIEVVKAKKRRRKEASKAKVEAPIPRIPLLHCSATNVRLYDIPARRMPHVFCHDPLQQQLPLVLRVPHGHMRRLNMVQQIPELGVVIIGSQLGRIAVCALTRNRNTGTLGFRVDWLLPTKRQERAGQRPNCLLLGIAAAPIQGRQSEPEPPSLAADDSRWGYDTSADGVKVSFDPGVVVLPEAKSVQETIDSDGEDQTGRAAKRHRQASTSTASTTSSSGASTEQRSWARPQPPPSYIENSRRFRVMMTYSDMTVLTYEISRDVEREDVAGAFELNA